MSATCRSCSAPIIWAEHHGTGRKMPLDADEVDIATAGSFVVIARKAYPLTTAAEAAALQWAVSTVRARELLTEESWHLSHFATCPQASNHRRPR